MSEFQKLSIKDWAVDDRPREKLMAKGIDSLSDAELLAILIGSGNRDESAVDLCKRILNLANNNLNELGKFSLNKLMEHKGIGEAKAITIVAALELGKRRKIADILAKQSLTCSRDIYELFHPILGDSPTEEFWVVFLNTSCKIIDKQLLNRGGLDSALVDVRIVMKMALEKLAFALILCHNHPSGNVQPSRQDIIMTEKIKNAAVLFDIKLHDHLIVTDGKYFSFADEGMI